jgi:hypothetical protein
MPACWLNDRDLPSWSCEFDSRHPLKVKALVKAMFVGSAIRCIGGHSTRAISLGHQIWATDGPSEPQLSALFTSFVRHLSTATDSQSGLSSGEHVFGRLFLVWLVVAEHGPEHVDASSGEGQYRLGVPLALGSFAVVIGLRGWAVLDADHG